MIASHDRAFLDEAVTTIIDLDPSALPHEVAGPLVGDGDGSGIGITGFTGSYGDYLHARDAARARWIHQYRDEQAELARLRAAVRENHSVGHNDFTPRSEVRAAAKFYADRNAKVVARRVNDARSRLEELEQRQIRKPADALQFRGLTAARRSTRQDEPMSGPVLTASNAAVTGRLPATSLTIGAGEKWLITGANGSGKSTLLHLFAGHLSPTSGTLHTPAQGGSGY